MRSPRTIAVRWASLVINLVAKISLHLLTLPCLVSYNQISLPFDTTTMTFISTDYKYIQLNENKVPIIAGTTMKVVELITSVQAYNWTPEQLHQNYPHVSMSKIYSALAYYWDNKKELDADMKKRYQFAEKMRQEATYTSLAEKLKARGFVK